MYKNILDSNNKKAFTLVEIIVAITMFSIIIISMVNIYTSIIWLTTKVDVTRAMQENIKNIVEHISSDIHKNWIAWVSKQSWINDCNRYLNSSWYRKWDKLCTWTWSNYTEYFVWLLWTNSRVDPDHLNSICSEIKNTCVLFKKKDWWDPVRLSNSMVSLKNFKVYISNEVMPKATFSIILRPSSKNWVTPNLIKNSSLIFETTISEKIIKSN